MARDHPLAEAGSEEDGSAAWSHHTARQARWENTPRATQKGGPDVTTHVLSWLAQGRENTRRRTPGEELWLEEATWLLENEPWHGQPGQSGHNCPVKSLSATKRKGARTQTGC